MNRMLLIGTVAMATAFSAPASAQVMIEMSEITCKQFASYDSDTKAFVANWMRGYFSSKNNLGVIDMSYVKRNTDKVLKHCKKSPKEALMTTIEKIAK